MHLYHTCLLSMSFTSHEAYVGLFWVISIDPLKAMFLVLKCLDLFTIIDESVPVFREVNPGDYEALEYTSSFKTAQLASTS